MFDVSTISIVLSGIVAAMEIFTFIDNRSIRKERSLNVFAKADRVKSDLDATRTLIDNLSNLAEEQESKLTDNSHLINDNAKDIAVIKERLSNEKEFINKLDDKLSRILEELYKE